MAKEHVHMKLYIHIWDFFSVLHLTGLDQISIFEFQFTRFLSESESYQNLYLHSNGRFPLGGIFRPEWYFLLSLTPALPQLVFKQKKMSLRAENSAQWKMAFKVQIRHTL